MRAAFESYITHYHRIEAGESEMAEFTLRIDGMHCGSCVRRVNQALAAVPGVVVGEVRVGAARFTVEQNSAPEDPANADAIAAAIRALAGAGYTAHLES